MRNLLFALMFVLPVFALGGCGEDSESGEKSWTDAETAAAKYLTNLEGQKFREAFDMHSKNFYPWNKAESLKDWTEVMTTLARDWPGAFAFTHKLERSTLTARSNLATFKVALTYPDSKFPKSNPGRPDGKEWRFYPAMQLTVEKVAGEGWQISTFGEWKEPVSLK